MWTDASLPFQPRRGLELIKQACNLYCPCCRTRTDATKIGPLYVGLQVLVLGQMQVLARVLVLVPLLVVVLALVVHKARLKPAASSKGTPRPSGHTAR